MKFKLVIAVRSDLELSRVKLAVQVAHPAVMAALDAKAHHRKWFADWVEEGQKKVLVHAGTLADLRALQAKARSMHLPTALVEDPGLTPLPPRAVTALGAPPGPPP